MSSVFLVKRRIKVGDGECVVTLRCDSRREDARDFAAKLQPAMAGLLDCHLVKMGKEGEGDDTGIELGQFLADLGIFGFALEVQEVELQGSMIQLAGTMPSGEKVWRS
jgi:hypothetical protein